MAIKPSNEPIHNLVGPTALLLCAWKIVRNKAFHILFGSLFCCNIVVSLFAPSFSFPYSTHSVCERVSEKTLFGSNQHGSTKSVHPLVFQQGLWC